MEFISSQLLRRVLVRAAFFAEADLSLAVRFLAAERACLDNAACETAAFPSFFNRRTPARERAFEIGSCL